MNSPKRTIIPFGPQHPVLPEPIHLDLIVEDEKVIEALPSLGFIHRGLERLVEKRDFIDFVYVAERICGICSFIHGLTYCIAIEELMKVEVPKRANYLRVIWSELSRIHSHLLWLGLMADGFGFEALFMHTWKLREKILDIIEETTGGRVIFGTAKIGGVRKDISPEKLSEIMGKLENYAKEIKE
ncbi:NADH-quinone oxidoreductase subunit D, partial [bacterium]